MILLFLAAIVSGYALIGLTELSVVTGAFATVLQYVGAGAVIVFAVVLIIKAIMELLKNISIK